MDNIQHKRGKIYYSMGEVAEMFDVKPSLIRFWEKKFDILKPHKNKKGNRMFTPEDVDNFRMIYHLVKEKGMTLEGARQRMKGKSGEELTRNMEIIDRLQAVKALLMEVKQSLNVGDGLPDDYWERDDEPLIGAAEYRADEETPAPEPAGIETETAAEAETAAPEPADDSPWIEEPAPAVEPPAEEPEDEESEETEAEEPEDEEFGFGRREEGIPDPFEYEPAEDYTEEPAAGPEDVAEHKAAAESEPVAEPEAAAEPATAAEPASPKPRRKRAAKSSNTLRLDDDTAEQAPKPRFIEQTLF